MVPDNKQDQQEWKICVECQGTGQVTVVYNHRPVFTICDQCDGKGWIWYGQPPAPDNIPPLVQPT